ncbi:MAG TPA: MoxR family ATPase [Vicinamibacterales bacterium]
MHPDIQTLQQAMEQLGYVADEAIATAVFLAREMRKPLLVEGEAGGGKTELAKVLAQLLNTELIRLQCYEGLDVNTALYEWNYPRQMLRARLAEHEGRDAQAVEALIFSREYLLERPLLRAITRPGGPAVLLIDEIDRADEGFEAFLLEVLSDFQVTIPELGTIRAQHIPHVILTSNRSREIARFMQAIRRRRLSKAPGVAEAIDWANALVTLHRSHLDPGVVAGTLGCVLKDRHDVEDLDRTDLDSLVAEARGR